MSNAIEPNPNEVLTLKKLRSIEIKLNNLIFALSTGTNLPISSAPDYVQIITNEYAL